MESAVREIITVILLCLCPIDRTAKGPLHDLKSLSGSLPTMDQSTNNAQLVDRTETNQYSGGSALVAVEPAPDDLVSLLRLVPEQPVAAALHHREFGVANVIAKMFRGDHMIAGIGIGFIFAAH